MNQVLENVKEAVSMLLDVKVEDLTEDTSLEDLGADSLDVVELVMMLEDEHDIYIDEVDDDFDSINTIGDLVKVVERNRASRP